MKTDSSMADFLKILAGLLFAVGGIIFLVALTKSSSSYYWGSMIVAGGFIGGLIFVVQGCLIYALADILTMSYKNQYHLLDTMKKVEKISEKMGIETESAETLGSTSFPPIPKKKI